MDHVEQSSFASKRYIGRFQGCPPPAYSLQLSEQAASSVKKKHILVVDDDPFFRSLLKVILGQTRCPIGDIWEAEDSGTAVGICNTKPVDMVFCDFNLPNFSSQNGLGTIREMREICPDVPVYMVTAENGEDLVMRVRAVGATGHLLKPLNLRTVRRIVQTLDEAQPPTVS